jgi:hypothetical protein
MKLPTHVLCAFALIGLPLAAGAQQGPSAAPVAASPATKMPTPDQLEPGVNTSANPAPAPSEPTAGTPGQSSAGANAQAQTPKAAAPASAATGGKAAAGTKAGNAKAKAGPDRLQLDATDITGNRELPKVLYIVPWKHADLGDLSGRPPNSLLDEVLQPLDRDVFRRENRYYDDLKPGAAAPKGGAAAGSGNNP